MFKLWRSELLDSWILHTIITIKAMIGRIKLKLIEVIESTITGIQVKPETLKTQPNGGSLFYDPASWVCVGRINGVPVILSSYDTMTACCKGITFKREVGGIEVFSSQNH